MVMASAAKAMAAMTGGNVGNTDVSSKINKDTSAYRRHCVKKDKL